VAVTAAVILNAARQATARYHPLLTTDPRRALARQPS